MTSFKKKLGFWEVENVESVGSSIGLALFWNSERVSFVKQQEIDIGFMDP